MDIYVKKVTIVTPEGFLEKGWGLYCNQYFAWYSRYYRTEKSAISVLERMSKFNEGVLMFNFTHNYPILGA